MHRNGDDSGIGLAGYVSPRSEVAAPSNHHPPGETGLTEKGLLLPPKHSIRPAWISKQSATILGVVLVVVLLISVSLAVSTSLHQAVTITFTEGERNRVPKRNHTYNIPPVNTTACKTGDADGCPRPFLIQSFLPEWVNVFIGSAEIVDRDDVKVKAWAASGGSPLFRKTTGYTGPKNFDIPTPLSYARKPNVIIVMLESFRARDVGLTSEHAPTMGRERWGSAWRSPTPNFDKWARKGISFNNTWASIMTSRSVETLQLNLIPFSTETSLWLNRYVFS